MEKIYTIMLTVLLFAFSTGAVAGSDCPQQLVTGKDTGFESGDCLSWSTPDNSHLEVQIFSQLDNVILQTEDGKKSSETILQKGLNDLWLAAGDGSTKFRIILADHQRARLSATTDIFTGIARLTILVMAEEAPKQDRQATKLELAQAALQSLSASDKANLQMYMQSPPLQLRAADTGSLCHDNNSAPEAPKISKASLNNNILQTKEMAKTPLPVKMLWFRDMVGNKQPWDFKQQNSIYEDYGNYHYGAIGAALGIPDEVLLRAAGWASLSADPARQDTWGHYLGFAPYGDDPKDQEWIIKGINYYKQVFEMTEPMIQNMYSDFCNNDNNDLFIGVEVISPLNPFQSSIYRRPRMPFFQLERKCNGCHWSGSVKITDLPKAD
jgi:hypothetical protein